MSDLMEHTNKRKAEESSTSTSSVPPTKKPTSNVPIVLTKIGHQAQVHVKQEKVSLPFTDITDLVIYAQYFTNSPIQSRFCELHNNANRVIFLIIDGFVQKSINQIGVSFPNFQLEITGFPCYDSISRSVFFLPLITSEVEYVINKYKNLRTAVKEHEEVLRQITSVFSIPQNEEVTSEINTKDLNIEKYLLTIADMITLKYPMPLNPNFESFNPTKDIYTNITPESKIYTFDCEMVRTVNKQELAWISVVDEDLKVVYESYVKPTATILDYNTKYSGIKKETLNDVTTTLEEVQSTIKSTFPDNVILGGHSIDSDLRAIQMTHPYLLDSSILYNDSNKIYQKPGLKKLTEKYFGKKIQAGKKGHNPREDFISAMNLIKLKIEKGLTFGNVRFDNSELEETEEFKNFIKIKRQTTVYGEKSVCTQYEKHYDTLKVSPSTSKDGTEHHSQNQFTNISILTENSQNDLIEKLSDTQDNSSYLTLAHSFIDNTMEPADVVKDISHKVWNSLKVNTLLIVAAGDSNSVKAPGLALISMKATD